MTIQQTLAAIPDEAVTTLSQSTFGAILVGAVAVMGGAVAMLWRANSKKDEEIKRLYEKRETDVAQLLEVINGSTTTLKSFEIALRREK